MRLSINDLTLQNKRVFIRVDFNVPVTEDGDVADDTRIRASLPTLQFLIEKGAKLILASHLGRPKGSPAEKYSLKPVIPVLSKLLDVPIKFAADCVGPEIENLTTQLNSGEILLLENLRFHKEEEDNSPEFAKSLANLADVYINDAFGTAHRAHASTEGITKHISQKAAGLLMERELSYLEKVLYNPDKPFVAILGGAKVSDKIEVVSNLLKRADTLLIGGGMAYTFLKARGIEIGKSLVEEDKVDLARQLESEATRLGVKFLLPVDHVVGDLGNPDIAPSIISTNATPIDLAGYDVGPQTIAKYSAEISTAKTVIWNGPMGIFENPLYSSGTFSIARAVASCSGLTVIGGGDSVAAINKAGLAHKISHISTGGGASLEFLAGLELPGVVALEQ